MKTDLSASVQRIAQCALIHFGIDSISTMHFSFDLSHANEAISIKEIYAS